MQHERLPKEVQDALAGRPPDDRVGAERVWKALGTLPEAPMDVPSDDAAWDELQQRLHLAPSSPSGDASRSRRTRRPTREPRRSLRLLRWSTAGLATALVLFALWWQRPVTVTVPMGVQQSVVLPDGSVVELNSASQLRYTRGFARLLLVASERSVRLDGEAFFRVVPGSRPFVVETFNSRVEVLGTQFNVRARPAETGRPATTAVTLAEGRVQVTGMGSADADRPLPPTVLVRPGDQVIVGFGGSEQSHEPVAVPRPDRFWAWRTAGFAFVDEPLADIVAELERRFALRITLEAGVDESETLSLFKQPGTTLEQVLHDLCLAQQCRYRTTSQGFALAPATPE